jgi:hypothetical protein
MSKGYINAALRRDVIARADGCCEYCRVDTTDRGIDFALDHVIAEKHGGPTDADNLCLSCYWCNSFKGSNITSVDWLDEGKVVPLFNPRQQRWDEHFQLDGVRIVPLTGYGRVTVDLLQMNSSQRVAERRLLIELGVYPCHQQ